MATVLIPTILDDIHAASVALALERMGHRAVRWFCGDVPEVSMGNYAIGNSSGEFLEIKDGSGSVSLDKIDVFWNRRVGAPVICSFIAESDKQVATRETTRFVSGLLARISGRTFSVNDYQQAKNAESKLVQLAAAREVGMTVPETLISNDPGKIRAFLLRHQAAGTVFKSFKPATWEGDDRVAIIYTSKVSVDDLPGDALLRLTPSIFQVLVPKAYEVRVTCMGNELVAARLHSQNSAQGRVDWRIASPAELNIGRIELPESVRKQCFALLRRLGLVFGCFDFIVTPDDDYVFLEVNQMGQFLWIEQESADIPLLQMFCEFLVSRDPQFVYSAKSRGSSYEEVGSRAIELIDQDRKSHLRPERYSHIFRE